MRYMADSTTVADLPGKLPMYAGYVDGMWPTYMGMVKAFPNAVHVSITTYLNDAQVIDVEKGNATPAQAAVWVINQRKAGKVPTLYCNTSTWVNLVKPSFASARVPLPQWWAAQYDNVPSLDGLPDQNLLVAKQYADPLGTGGHYDMSIVRDYWEGVDAVTQPQNVWTQVIDPKAINPAPAQDILADVFVHVRQLTDAVAALTAKVDAIAAGGGGTGQTFKGTVTGTLTVQ